MRESQAFAAALFLVTFLVGCAAMYVPVTNDPNKKLDQAYELIQHQERPLPAEKLIRESIELYEDQVWGRATGTI